MSVERVIWVIVLICAVACVIALATMPPDPYIFPSSEPCPEGQVQVFRSYPDLWTCQDMP